jgi:hypothetical protein
LSLVNATSVLALVVFFIALDKLAAADDEEAPSDAAGKKHSDDTGCGHGAE